MAGVALYKWTWARIEAPTIESDIEEGRAGAGHDEREGRRRIGEVVGGSGRVGTAVQTERVKSGGIVNIRENDDQIVGRSWQDFATVIQLSQEVYNT